MSDPKVLRVNATEEQSRYRDAISTILLNIQRDHKVTLHEIAERIDISLGTVSNAANKKCDLNGTHLKRLAQAFGPCTLDPYAALSGGRIVPIDADDGSDALPSISASVHRLAVAQSPGSDGGVAITHRELLAMEPELRAACKALSMLLDRARRVAA